jgi:hypothetical protein
MAADCIAISKACQSRQSLVSDSKRGPRVIHPPASEGAAFSTRDMDGARDLGKNYLDEAWQTAAKYLCTARQRIDLPATEGMI